MLHDNNIQEELSVSVLSLSQNISWYQVLEVNNAFQKLVRLE